MLRLFLMRRKAGRRDGGEIAITHVFFFFFLTTKQSSRFFPQSSFIVLDRLLKGHLQGLCSSAVSPLTARASDLYAAASRGKSESCLREAKMCQ